MGVDVFKTFVALAFVLGLIFVIAWAYRKYLPTGAPAGKDTTGWRILGSRMLGPGRQLMVLEIGKKLLIVGLSKEQISPLMEVENDEDIKLISDALSNKQSVSFAEILKRAKS